MNQEEHIATGLSGLGQFELDVVLRSCLERLPAIEAQHKDAGAAFTEATRVLAEAQRVFDQTLQERDGLERVINSIRSRASEASDSTRQADTHSPTQPEELKQSEEALLALSSQKEPEEDEDEGSPQTGQGQGKKRLNVRTRLVDIVESGKKLLSTREIFELACAYFNLVLPLSTVNSGLSMLVVQNRLIRFLNDEGKSLYGRPDWFVNGKPKPEYFASLLKNPAELEFAPAAQQEHEEIDKL